MRYMIAAALVCVLAVLPAVAQGAPEQMNAALAALSQQVGRAVTLADLEAWRWEQQLFGDTSLGCPQPGSAYTQVQTSGYIFTLGYQGTTYEYRVSVDASITVLCQTVSADGPTPTPTEPAYSNPLCPPPEVGKAPYMRTRLAPGITARVTAGSLNRLRDAAGLNAAQIGEIPAGAVFKVIGGPECVDEILWWQVDYDGRQGWTAEGQGGGYFVEPFPPLPFPERVVIDATNAAQLVFFGQVEGNFAARLAWSPDGQRLALLGAHGSDALWVYTTAALTQPPALYPTPDLLYSLAFHPDNQQILFGTNAGGAHLWNLRPEALQPEALYLKTHEQNSVVALHPDGVRFAAGGSLAQTTLVSDRANAILLWNMTNVAQEAAIIGHTAPVIALAYSPDGGLLASVDSGGTLLLTPMERPNQPLILSGISARSVVFSPNRQFVAVGKSSGAIDLIDPAAGSVIATYTGHLAAVLDLSFSPDSSLLASVSEDGTLRVWNTQDDSNLAVLEVSAQAVRAVEFAPQGTLIAAVADDSTLRFYGVGE